MRRRPARRHPCCRAGASGSHPPQRRRRFARSGPGIDARTVCAPKTALRSCRDTSRSAVGLGVGVGVEGRLTVFDDDQRHTRVPLVQRRTTTARPVGGGAARDNNGRPENARNVLSCRHSTTGRGRWGAASRERGGGHKQNQAHHAFTERLCGKVRCLSIRCGPRDSDGSVWRRACVGLSAGRQLSPSRRLFAHDDAARHEPCHDSGLTLSDGQLN